MNEREEREVLQEVESILMIHVALVEARDLKDSTELTSEADNESIPPKQVNVFISKNQALQIVHLKHHDMYIKLHKLSWIRN